MKFPTVNTYKCDACGKVEPWGDGWRWLGSWIMWDVHPELLIHVCSKKCQTAMQKKMGAGEVQQPVVKARAPNTFKVVGKRVGY